MRFVHTLVVASWSLLIVGLAAAYASAGVGLAGLVDVRTASLVTILAIIVALCALITHFVTAMRELKSSAHRF
jgi:uncharacterized membrane protein